jgi:hypothetical protein
MPSKLLITLVIALNWTQIEPAQAADSKEASPFRAGEWEITRKMSGGPRSGAANTYRVCINEADLKADAGAPLSARPVSNQASNGPQCTLGAAQLIDGKIALEGVCEGPRGTITPKWTGRYTATDFTLSGKIKVGPMSMTMKTKGQHLGACQAPATPSK